MPTHYEEVLSVLLEENYWLCKSLYLCEYSLALECHVAGPATCRSGRALDQEGPSGGKSHGGRTDEAPRRQGDSSIAQRDELSFVFFPMWCHSCRYTE